MTEQEKLSLLVFVRQQVKNFSTPGQRWVKPPAEIYSSGEMIVIDVAEDDSIRATLYWEGKRGGSYFKDLLIDQ